MPKSRLPPVTHLQFLILGCLLDDEQPGRFIRETIAGYGVRRTAPAFYQVMARLERSRLVEGFYEQVTVGDQAVTERRYRLRAAGERAWRETCEFYRTAPGAARAGWSNA